MIYVFKCPTCGIQLEELNRAPREHVGDDHTTLMVRDWRAEAVGVQVFTSALGDDKVQTKHVNKADINPQYQNT
jgi:hypothetical protein